MAYVNIMRTVKAVALLGGMMAGLVMATPAEVDKITRGEIAERIAPAGEVCFAGQPCATAAPVAAASGPQSGEQVFGSYCTACHISGILGAPKKGDASAWEGKLAAAGSYDQLLTNAINGIRSMPPKGTCATCSKEEISGAIEFMSGLKP